jgi:hypothetical protein
VDKRRQQPRKQSKVRIKGGRILKVNVTGRSSTHKKRQEPGKELEIKCR